MKLRIVVCTFVFLATTAFATSVDFANQGGTLTGSSAGLSMAGSVLVGINAGSLITGNLGTVGFTTGALTSGSLAMGGTFAPGGSFTIVGNGTDGIENGVIFAGTFDSSAAWALITLANGTHDYTLTGTISGTWFSGASVSGATVQLTINTGKGFFNGQTFLASGDTNVTGVGIRIAPTPEPGTLGLMGLGLMGLGALTRKRIALGLARSAPAELEACPVKCFQPA
jgi:hypothetical protein